MAELSGCLDLGDLGSICIEPLDVCRFCNRPSSHKVLTQAKPPATIDRVDTCDRCIGSAIQEGIEDLRRLADRKALDGQPAAEGEG